MGQRVLLAARKSRKGDDEATQFERQEARTRQKAERDGNTVIHVTHDVVSSQTMPWERKELKSWMTDQAKMSLYDAILVETDRLARVDDEGWHYIEHWCYENDKKIITAEGVQFPPRDASDKYQWIGLKDRARSYWEDVRDKHAHTREIIRANGGAIGLAPFGYIITGARYRKTFVIDPVWGPVAHEAFTRTSEGHTATSVAIWLSEQTGKPWRVKRVTDMIKRRTYLGERDGLKFDALVTAELFDSANAAMNARSFVHKNTGGRRVEHGYSGLLFCECGSLLYRHQSSRNGKDVGQAKYRCSSGRTGDLSQVRCSYGAAIVSEVDEMIDGLMARNMTPEFVMVTTGGDYGKQSELSGLQDAMKAAMAKMDMGEVTRLAQAVTELQGRESEPVRMTMKETGRTYGQVWESGDLADRRDLLGRLAHKIVVKKTDDGWKAVLENI